MFKKSLIVCSLLLFATTTSAQVLLYDNGPLVTHPGAGLGGADASTLEFAGLGLDIFGFGAQRTLPTIDNRMVDDFHSCGMLIQEIELFAYQTGSTTTSTITGAYLEIFDGDPRVGTPNRLFGDLTTNRMSGTTFTNIYRTQDATLLASTRPIMSVRVAVNPPLVVPPGSFWLQFQFSGSLASGPWAPPITILGVKPTGNGSQHQNATPPGVWVDAQSGLERQGLPFRIFGVPSGPTASAVTYGAAKPGTNGAATWSTARPFKGLLNYPLQINNGLDTAVPVVIIGTTRTNVVLPGLATILNDAAVSVLFPAFLNNTSRIRLEIPHFCGAQLNLQGFFLDTGAVNGLAHTDGLELTIGN